MLTPEDYAATLTQAASGPEGFFSGFPASKVSFAVQELIEKAIQDRGLTAIEDLMPTFLSYGMETAYASARAGPEGDVTVVRAAIEDQMHRIFTALKAGLWAGAGSSFSGFVEDFMGTSTLVQGYKTLAYNIAVTPRLRRLWNREFSPNWPNMTMAFTLMLYDYMIEADVLRAGAMDGWSADHAKALLETMWYTPSLYDLTRLADFTELDQTWALKQMRQRGLKDEDMARIWGMLEIRPLREEVRTITGKGLYCRQHGYWTHDYFEGVLMELKLKTKEVSLLSYAGDVAFQVELIEEWIETLRWRFRTALISEEEFLQGLLDLDVVYEKANVIVEQEKAKGYYGYY